MFSLSKPTAKVDLSPRNPAGIHIKWNTQRPEDHVDLGWDQTRWRRLGFTFQRFKSSSASSVSSTTSIAVPFWFLAAPFAVAPSIWFFAIRRRRRWKRRGLCPACQYDLRATPQRCPECGWIAGASDAAAARRRRVYTGILTAQLAAAVTFIFLNWPTSPRSPWVSAPPLTRTPSTAATRPAIASSGSTCAAG
jgi:hypothetical protein